MLIFFFKSRFARRTHKIDVLHQFPMAVNYRVKYFFILSATCVRCIKIYHLISLVRKAVFGVSDQDGHTLGCAATEDS